MSLTKDCIERGMRMTGQRRVIAKVLESSGDHPDIQELHRRAVLIDSNISISTLYRTMLLFEDAGMISKHDFGDGKSRYEMVSESHHDHLIDMQTGEVIEFTNDEIERLQESIASQLGYKLVDHRLELYGISLAKKEKD